MGLYCFPGPREGVLPLLLINTVVKVALLKNMVKSLFLLTRAGNSEEDSSNESNYDQSLIESSRARRVSITRYESLCRNRCSSIAGKRGGAACSCSENGGHMWPVVMECCVCLCKFEDDEEVSELLSCKHFFHKSCLEKWFDSNNQHSTCPLCRSVL